jgi:mRNA-degrading endonuclease RelE of RelBE toxin-antitoxin system
MTQASSVLVTARFERDARSLERQTGFEAAFSRAIATLRADPLNRSRQHDIPKLENVPVGEGQYRLRIGRFRFIYDIEGTSVYLKHCRLRREDTYRR